jgi:hypothetical protein
VWLLLTLLLPIIIQIFLDIIVGWAAASSSWRGNIVQLPYAVARLNIAGYIDEHNYYFGTNSGKHKSYGGNGSSNSSNNSSSSSNGTNHIAIGPASQSNNGRLAKRLLHQKYSYNRHLNKELQHQYHHQPQPQQRIKKNSYSSNRWQTDQYPLHTKSKINDDSSKHCGRFTSVFASVECLLSFISLYFTRSPSQQSVKYPSEEILLSESKKIVGRVRRKRQGLAAWSNFTVPPTYSPTPG